MKSSTYEFIHVWNVPWNYWNLRRMNSYTYEMFRETFLSCNKSNAYEIVVYDWSMPIIVTSFNMGDTHGLPHPLNNVNLCRVSRLKCKFWWQWTFINSVIGGCELSVMQINTFDCLHTWVKARLSLRHGRITATSRKPRGDTKHYDVRCEGLVRQGCVADRPMKCRHFIRVWFVTRMISYAYDL